MRGLLAVAVLMMGCGAVVVPGETCEFPKQMLACTASEVAYCAGSTWREFPCPGTCAAGECDWAQVQEGDACASSAGMSWARCVGDRLLLCGGTWRFHWEPCPSCRSDSLGSPVCS